MKRVLAVLMAAMTFGGVASASERQFTYTYDTNVLNPGDKELEPWTTAKVGRDGFYAAFENRLEFEMGVIDNLQTAWYINFSSVAAGMGPTRQESFTFDGVSWEWKYKLLDNVADPLGFALYAEVGAGPSELELESKLLFDKRFGNILIAANLVGELEWEVEAGEVVREFIFEVDAGVSYMTDFGLAIGLELMNHNEFVGGIYEHSALYVGPVVSYATKSWWVAATVMPQVGAPHGGGDTGYVLDEHERLNARVLFGWHL